jgi:hypothetical protein
MVSFPRNGTRGQVVARVDLMTADFVVEWQLGQRAGIRPGAEALGTSEDGVVVIPDRAPTPKERDLSSVG